MLRYKKILTFEVDFIMSSIPIGFVIFHYLVNQGHLFVPYYDYVMVMVIIFTK